MTLYNKLSSLIRAPWFDGRMNRVDKKQNKKKKIKCINRGTRTTVGKMSSY